jgi:hypothetical protein
MSVINTPDERGGHACNGPCLVCGDALRFPFLVWEGIRVCSGCCLKIKNGFMADMIHLAAIAELRKFYPSTTLVRTPNKYCGHLSEHLKYSDPAKEAVDIRTGKQLEK